MKLNNEGIALLHRFEGCRLKAYKCPAGVWTIGWGNTRYEDGTLVKSGDVITQQRADGLFKTIVEGFAANVRRMLIRKLTDNQFSALVSFAYNCGTAALQGSTLLRKVNADPADKTIAAEFAKWMKAGGKVLPGLITRRKAEADLYFKA